MSTPNSPLLREIIDQIGAAGHIAEEALEGVYGELDPDNLGRMNSLCVYCLGSALIETGSFEHALTEFSTGSINIGDDDYVTGDWKRNGGTPVQRQFHREIQTAWTRLHRDMPGRLSDSVAEMVAVASAQAGQQMPTSASEPRVHPIFVDAAKRTRDIIGPLKKNLASLSRTKGFTGVGSIGWNVVGRAGNIVDHLQNFCDLVGS